MAQVALHRADERTTALRDSVTELLSLNEPRKRIAAEMSGLGIRYDLGEGHPLLGRRMPDLDLAVGGDTVRVFSLLHAARAVLINFGEPLDASIAAWNDRVRFVDATYDGKWELPAIGTVAAPTAVLVRPDGYVAWVGSGDAHGLRDALSTWFGVAS